MTKTLSIHLSGLINYSFFVPRLKKGTSVFPLGHKLLTSSTTTTTNESMSAGTEHMSGVMLMLADLLLENFVRVALLSCQHLSLTLQSSRLLPVLMSAGSSRVFRGSGSESQGQSGAERSDINAVRKLIKMQLNVIIAVGVQYLAEAGGGGPLQG